MTRETTVTEYILAQAIADDWRIEPIDGDFCRFCNAQQRINRAERHEPDCPVPLAKRIVEMALGVSKED